jgi:hypothetical protein
VDPRVSMNMAADRKVSATAENQTPVTLLSELSQLIRTDSCTHYR